MPRTTEQIYATNNEYRRKRYKSDETFREYYQTKAREYARTHKKKMSEYHKKMDNKKEILRKTQNIQ